MTESSVSADFEPALLSYDALSASPSEISGAFALPLLERPADSGQPLCINAPSQTLSHLCLSFLALIQHLDVDFLPIAWHSALAGARRGGTAQLHQMAIDCQSAFAFKRLLPLRGEQGEKDWLMLQTEVSVLGQPAVLGCKNIVAIEGLTWHISRETTQPWPVLVFEKAGWGDLMSFVERGPGGEMDLSARLDLCAHVLAAVTVLHETHIIHGDIKPQNVLVFDGDGESGKYLAKVADFGYSGVLRNPTAKIVIRGTELWAAPEYAQAMTVDFETARRMDIFSLGWLCLWLLFYNRPETGGGRGQNTSDFLAHRQTKKSLVRVALDHIKTSRGMDEELQRDLASFFEQSLQLDPAERTVGCRTLHGLITRKGTDDVPIPPPEIHDLEINEPTFKIGKSLPQLLLADYRIHQYITKCLKDVVDSADWTHHADSTLTAYAVELALCYKIGFGTDRDEAALENLARRARVGDKVLEDALAEIKASSDGPHFNNRAYRGMIENGLDFRVDHDQNYLSEGVLDSAIERYCKDVANMSAVFGPTHRLTLIVSVVLCYALRTAGQWEKAILQRIELTSFIGKIKGERDRDTLASKSQLAAIYLDLDELDQAENLLLQVRDGLMDLASGKDNEVQENSQALAEVFRRKGKWQDAQDLLLPALEERERSLGLNHPDTLRLVSKLAALYLSQNEFDSAQKLLERLVEHEKWRLGSSHSRTLTSMSQLATVYYHQEKLEEAEKLYKHVEIKRTELRGEEHKETLIVRSNLASLYKKLNKYDEAEQLEEHILKTKVRKFGKDNASTLTTRGNLALTYAFQKRWEEARSLGSEVVEAKRRVLGPDHPSTLRSICNLAEAHVELKETGEARALLLQGLQDALDAGRAGEFEMELLEAALADLAPAVAQ
ncbi:hypothetical protein PV08_08798 [Exophiala spinifera]|uniref:Protein kinase domain-containing protein n=1 Tax=Exophiala spinifera TaxID=91928 RepID=A0A0D2B3W9_9EURO|nr:uncharacterized protein PV08_08798 [Exophiala spinifera]KIW13608.1 hypothetical protein PV08_08798 [Exophiala spinifera]